MVSMDVVKRERAIYYWTSRRSCGASFTIERDGMSYTAEYYSLHFKLYD